MMEEQHFHPLDYLDVIRRRKWWFIGPLLVCLAVGAALAALLPREYRSQAEIGIAAPTLSPELLRGVQSVDARERQRAISQQLLSRTVLERVVREEDLGGGRPVEAVAQWLRTNVEQNIEVPQPIGSGRRDGLESFRLGYVDSSPERAQRITNKLATVFVEENSKTQARRLENTAEVLAQQLRASQERLSGLQEQLRTKKEAYMGRLPDQMNANIQMVNGLRQQHDSLSLQLRAEQDRLSNVEAQLEQMKQAGGGGMTSMGAAAVQGAQNRIAQLQQQLTQYRAAGYTEKHPAVVLAQEELAAARRDLTAARGMSGGADGEVLAADPLYKQKLQERSDTRMRISTLQRQIQQALSQIASYQTRVEAAPLVEQELSSLVTNVKLEETRYAQLATQYQNAVTAEDLERKQGGERFVVLNPAYLPGSPVTPNVPRLLLLALGLGLGLGVMAVVGREFLDRSVHDARALQSAFEVPVLGEIPRIQGAEAP